MANGILLINTGSAATLSPIWLQGASEITIPFNKNISNPAQNSLTQIPEIGEFSHDAPVWSLQGVINWNIDTSSTNTLEGTSGVYVAGYESIMQYYKLLQNSNSRVILKGSWGTRSLYNWYLQTSGANGSIKNVNWTLKADTNGNYIWEYNIIFHEERP